MSVWNVNATSVADVTKVTVELTRRGQPGGIDSQSRMVTIVLIHGLAGFWAFLTSRGRARCDPSS